MVDRLLWAAVGLAVLGLLALMVPYLLGAYYLDRGAAVRAEDSPAAVADLERAVVWEPRNVQARRKLAQVHLKQDQPQAALDALRPALDIRPPNTMVSLELVAPYVAVDQPDAAIHVYESAAVDWPSRAAAVAYLQQAEASELLSAAELWRKALSIDTGNLYALLRLWQTASAAGDEDAAGDYEERLRHFDLQSVRVPSDLRLAEFQARGMGEAVEAGIWTRETLLSVVSYQVWRFADGDAAVSVDLLLRSLLARWPDDPDLRFYRAELYHRRGEAEQAATAYQTVLEADAGFAQAVLRLGMVCEAQGKLTEAVDWYSRYRAMVPDDLLGLQRLTELREVLGASEAPTLREILLDLTDDRRIVARMLKVPVEDVDLGPNLIQNGDFDLWAGERPRSWTVSDMATGSPWNRGLFFGGRDDLWVLNRGAARLQGLWLERRDDKAAGRWGYWQYDELSRRISSIALGPGTRFVVSLNYRSDNPGAMAAGVYVSDREDVTWRGDERLPVSGGVWHHFVAIGHNRGREEIGIRMLLRNWDTGSVAFDSVRLARLGIRGQKVDNTQHAQFWVSGP